MEGKIFEIEKLCHLKEEEKTFDCCLANGFDVFFQTNRSNDIQYGPQIYADIFYAVNYVNTLPSDVLATIY